MYLLKEIEHYLRSSQISAATFGRTVMRDPRFVFDLRNGREPGARTVNRVRAYIGGAK
jgi:2,4-dienoyl-CoA reductase-like NADH-dependent reductase (Old Yellow Enzyme family)